MTQGCILDILLALCLLFTVVFSIVLDIYPDGGLHLKNKCIGNTCLFLRLTGIECPFCGISRSMVALMHGQIKASISFHPLGVVISALFLLYIISVSITVYRCKTAIVERNIFIEMCLSLMAISAILWCVSTISNYWENINELMIKVLK